MGFFSKTCAKTHLPVMARLHGEPREYSQVVALFKNGDKVSGYYDGYGRVDHAELVDDWDEVKFVLQKFYNNEKYEDLGPSKNDWGQGYFHDMGRVAEWFAKGGFATYEEYKSAYFAPVVEPA